MSANPYQAPAAAEESTLPALPIRLPELLEHRRRKLIIRGARIISVGYAIFLAFFIASKAQAYALPTATSITGTLIYASGLGLLVSLVGVSCFLSLGGTAQKLAVLALSLQMLSMFAMLAVVSVQLSGRPVSGLFQLFAASSLAALLTSQAIVALVIRRWLKNLRVITAYQVCDLSIIGLALCAALYSSVALGTIPRGIDGITPVIVVTGVFAAASLLSATVQLTVAVNQLADESWTDAAAAIDS